jgi:hypothetical protein
MDIDSDEVHSFVARERGISETELAAGHGSEANQCISSESTNSSKRGDHCRSFRPRPFLAIAFKFSRFSSRLRISRSSRIKQLPIAKTDNSINQLARNAVRREIHARSQRVCQRDTHPDPSSPQQRKIANAALFTSFCEGHVLFVGRTIRADAGASRGRARSPAARSHCAAPIR